MCIRPPLIEKLCLLKRTNQFKQKVINYEKLLKRVSISYISKSTLWEEVDGGRWVLNDEVYTYTYSTLRFYTNRDSSTSRAGMDTSIIMISSMFKGVGI